MSMEDVKPTKDAIVTAESVYSSSTISQPRTIRIVFDNWKWRKATLFEGDQTTELYRVECHLRSPQIIMNRVNDPNSSKGEATVGLSSSAHIKLNGSEFKLQARMIKDEYSFKASVRDGEELTWRRKSKMDFFDMICRDKNEAVVARLDLNCWKLKNIGTVELVDERAAQDGPGMDEVILTALVMVYLRMTFYASAVA